LMSLLPWEELRLAFSLGSKISQNLAMVTSFG
jgi:hypothetical protein